MCFDGRNVDNSSHLTNSRNTEKSRVSSNVMEDVYRSLRSDHLAVHEEQSVQCVRRKCPDNNF